MSRANSARRPAPAAAVSPLTAVTIVFRYGLRACLPRKRRIGLLIPALGAILFGLLARAVGDDTAQKAFATIASPGIFGIVLPIGTLVVGDAVLGAEIRAGTIHFTWLSPVSRWAIVVGRWLAGTVVAAAALGVACALAAVVAGVPGEAVALAVSVAFGCAAYVALFVLFGAAARRAVVWSLGAVILGERLLGAALDGIAQLSPGWLARGAFGGLTDSSDLIRKGIPNGGPALYRLVVVSAIALAIAAARLAELRPSGGGGD